MNASREYSNYQVTVVTNKRTRIHESGFFGEAQAVRMTTALYSNGNTKMLRDERVLSVTAEITPFLTKWRYR